MAGVLDYGAESREHLQMVLEHALELRGWDATVRRATPAPEPAADVVYPNEESLESFYGEHTYEPPETETILVLLGEDAIQGLNIPDYVSLTDKLEDNITIYTFAELNCDDRIDVATPDGETLTLQIVNEPAVIGTSRLSFSYTALAV